MDPTPRGRRTEMRQPAAWILFRISESRSTPWGVNPSSEREGKPTFRSVGSFRVPGVSDQPVEGRLFLLDSDDTAGSPQVLEKMKVWCGGHQVIESHYALR